MSQSRAGEDTQELPCNMSKCVNEGEQFLFLRLTIYSQYIIDTYCMHHCCTVRSFLFQYTVAERRMHTPSTCPMIKVNICLWDKYYFAEFVIYYCGHSLPCMLPRVHIIAWIALAVTMLSPHPHPCHDKSLKIPSPHTTTTTTLTPPPLFSGVAQVYYILRRWIIRANGLFHIFSHLKNAEIAGSHARPTNPTVPARVAGKPTCQAWRKTTTTEKNLQQTSQTKAPPQSLVDFQLAVRDCGRTPQQQQAC